MNNLIYDELIRIRLAEKGVVERTLPGVLADLNTRNVESFPALMRHQRHAWFAFLVQLAALATVRRRGRDLPDNEKAWTELLRALAPQWKGDEPWSLVVEESKAPAFFQPPISEKSLKNWKGPFHHPDDVDILVTAKQHDVKSPRIVKPRPEHWIYALVTLQTMQGFLGAGNYGISRMNGGFSNRPCATMVGGSSWSDRFRRDVRILTEERDALLDDHPHYKHKGGHSLLWLEPWNGKSSLETRELDPWYIEVCRRIRLVGNEGKIAARTTPTKKARVAGKELNGNTGDAWTPVDVERGAGLTVSANGFTFDLVRKILFDANYRKSLCLKFREDDPKEGMRFLGQALVRGQGETEGYHEREIPIPHRVRMFLLAKQGQDRMAQKAEERVRDASTFQSKILRPAILAYLQGGPESINWKDERAREWVGVFTGRVDDEFFHHLWKTFEKQMGEDRTLWRRRLVDIARDVLREAQESLPHPSARRYRALAASDRLFGGAVYRNCEDLRIREAQ